MKYINFSNPIVNKIVYLTGATVVLLAIFLYSNPERVSLGVLLLPFLLIGFIVYQLTELGFMLIGRSNSKRAVKKLVGLSLAFAIVALLLLASLGQLTVRDGLLVVGFIILFLWYISRADFLESKDRS